jgi:type I restriction enzyme S subunit
VSELPNSWTMGSIADLVDVGPKNECDDSTVVGFVPMNRMGTTFRDIPTFEARKWGEVKKGYTHFADGDVLVARITPCFENGKAGIAQGLPSRLGAGSTEYVVLRPKAGVATAEYVLARLKTNEFLLKGADSMTGAVGQQRVPKAVIESYPVPIAPFPEQQRISLKLTTLLADVDACRERLDRVPRILKKIREAVLAAAVSGRLTEEWRVSSKRTSNWAQSTIGDSAFVTKLAGFEYTKFVRYVEDGDLRVLKAENAGHWGFKSTSFSKVRSADVAGLTRSRLKEGDVLMVFVGAGTGRVARVPAGGDWFLGPNIAMIRPELSKLLPAYLDHYFRSRPGWDQIALYTKSVAQPSLSMKTIRLMEIALPSLEEQAEIVRRIDALFALADRLEQRYSNALAWVEKLAPSIMAKAFRGELVPQDPNDEPAGVMLGKVRAADSADRTPTVVASGIHTGASSERLTTE